MSHVSNSAASPGAGVNRRGSDAAPESGGRGRDWGLMALRVGVGGTLVAHGTQKLFGWFGGAGLTGTAAGFERFGFRPGRANAVVAGLSETGGGALLALGLGTPGASAAAVGTMAVASTVQARNGFFAANGGFEYPAMLGWSAAALTLTGPGRFSMDHALHHRLNRPWMRTTALAAAVSASTAMILRRRHTLRSSPPADDHPADEPVS